MNNKKGFPHWISSILVVCFLMAFIVVFLVSATGISNYPFDQSLNTTDSVSFTSPLNIFYNSSESLTALFLFNNNSLKNSTGYAVLSYSPSFNTLSLGGTINKTFLATDTEIYGNLSLDSGINSPLYLNFDSSTNSTILLLRGKNSNFSALSYDSFFNKMTLGGTQNSTEISTNTQIDGNLTANNLCYSNGSNCQSQSVNLSNYTQKGTPSVMLVLVNPAGTTSATYKMMGLGNNAGVNCSFTPTKSGVVKITIDGIITTVSSSQTAQGLLTYGTGIAPVNNGNIAGGSVNSSIFKTTTATSGTVLFPFSRTITFSVSPNTKTWCDVMLEESGSSTGSINSLTANIEELPY
jgi:hypothetical protein